MKKNLTLICLLLSLFVGTNLAQAQSTVTIGTGTTTQRFPLGCFWGFERTATIYTPAEIGRFGTIEKLRWYMTAHSTNAFSIKIYLKHTTANNWTAAATTYASEAAGAKLVYADSARTLASGQWVEFTLNDTFNYNGTSNLEVIVETNNGGSGFANTNMVRYTAGAANTNQTWNADGNPPAGTGTRSANRPNIQIEFGPFYFADLGILALISPTVACNMTTYDLRYRISNTGATTLPSGSYIRYSYRLNGASPVVDSALLTSDLANGNTLDMVFNSINVLNVTNLSFQVSVDHNSDQNKINNTVTYVVANPSCIAKDSSDAFTNGPGGFVGESPWVRARLTRFPFTGATGSIEGWITDSAFQYPVDITGSLYTPFLDLSMSCVPTFEWDMRMDVEAGWDAMVVEISTDNVNWIKVTSLTPVYNNTSVNGPITAPKYSGDNGSWQRYSADLSAWKGNPVVRLRFRFGSDPSVPDNGIAIDNVRFDIVSNYTGAAFTSPDTVFANSIYDTEFAATSPDQLGIDFSWELDGVEILNTKEFSYTFPTPGTYTMKHVARDNCGVRLDSVSRTIVVVNPSKKPDADFIADVNTPGLLDLVTFQNLSTQGPTYQWIISPEMIFDPDLGFTTEAYYYQNGTSDVSKNPVVAFYYSGQYDVCLIATNSLGVDTLCKPQYIVVGQSGPTSGGDSLMCSGSITTLTSGKVFDSGGPNANYVDNENCSFTIDFNCFDSLRMQWNAFNLENGFDFLKIYDGDPFSGTPLWNSATTPNGLTGAALPQTGNFYATSGIVTIVMTTDFVITAPGFSLSYEMLSPKGTPVASFEVADTVCVGYFTDFVNTSISGTNYEWDYFGTNSNMGTTKDGVFVYATAGTYNVRLIVSNCVGADTFVKSLVVLHPASMATEFEVDRIKATINDVVSFTDATKGCVDNYEWIITPATFTPVSGSMNGPMVGINFTQAGFYDIKLITHNSVTSDSIVKTAFIEITNICKPTVTNPLKDVGISRVSLNDLENTTGGGDGYTDFPTMMANVIAGATYNVEVDRPSTSNEVTRMVWIDYNADGDFDDAGELVAMDGPGRTRTLVETITIPRSAYIGIVTMRVSSSYGTYQNNPCGNKSFGETQDYRVNIRMDAVAPVITLLGLPSVTVNVNDVYIDAQATAVDDIDGNITAAMVTNNPVNTATPGTYTIEYNVSDSAGNAAIMVTREVIVLPEAPILMLVGQNPDTMNVFTSYGDMGVDARDYANNFLQFVVTGNLDTAVVGTYTVTYTATDGNGRSTSIDRTVVVVDVVAPVGELIGEDTITIEVFGTFNDPGLTLSDNYCAVSQISYTASTVSLTTLGFKTITYDIEDCNGNTSTVTRTIRVVDTKAPVISLKGPLVANVVRLRPYTDEGYDLSDNFYDAANITVEMLTTLITTETVGLYTLQYKATDGSGNVSYSETRFIYIIDNVGVTNLESSKLNVYPNPTTADVTLTTDRFEGEEIHVVLIDMFGKVVLEQDINKFNGTVKLHMGDLAAGVYMVTLVNGNNQVTGKIVLNK